MDKLLKSPYSTHIASVALITVVGVPIVEEEEVRNGGVVLRATPIGSKIVKTPYCALTIIHLSKLK
jgi:hypothetical protein